MERAWGSRYRLGELRNVNALDAAEAAQILVLVFVGAAFMGGAAGAATVDLTGTGGDLPGDRLWTHDPWSWSLATGVLGCMALALTLLLAVRMRTMRPG
jgi:hypothetical protein